VANLTPWPQHHHYPLKRILVGLHSQSRCCGKRWSLLQLAGIAPQLLGCTAGSLCIIPTELLWLLIMLGDEYILWKPAVPNLLCSSYIFSSWNASECCALCKTVCLNHNELASPLSLNKNLPILQTTECPSNSLDINRQHFVLCCCILKRNHVD
jgi:hypothetical protein